MLLPDAPRWLSTIMLRELSSVPMQSDRHGVRAVVEFLTKKQKGEPFEYIGKVIGSVPSWITTEVQPCRIPLILGLCASDCTSDFRTS
jgi:hypothetical protein